MYDQEFHYIISFFCWFDYNNLQFHFMGHHMKLAIDYMRAHMVKYEEAINSQKHFYPKDKHVAAAFL